MAPSLHRLHFPQAKRCFCVAVAAKPRLQRRLLHLINQKCLQKYFNMKIDTNKRTCLPKHRVQMPIARSRLVNCPRQKRLQKLRRKLGKLL